MPHLTLSRNTAMAIAASQYTKRRTGLDRRYLPRQL
jgi:hypothetical protein